MYGTSWQGKYWNLWNTRTDRSYTYRRKRTIYCSNWSWSEGSAAFTWTDKRKRDQYLYSWWNAPSPCLSILKEISSSKRKFWNRMAESTERVWSSSRSDPLHYQLPDASKKQLCWQSVYNRSCCFPRHCSYRWEKRFYTSYWKSTGTGWLQRRSNPHRYQRWYESNNWFWSCSHPVPCRYCNKSCKIRRYQPFLLGCRLWWC